MKSTTNLSNRTHDTTIYRRYRYAGSATDRIGSIAVFGGKKIPELMKGIGKGVRSFKEGMNNIEKEVEDSEQKK